MSERLGLVQAGEFRSGNGHEPGFGFSGVRLGYPAFAYAGDTWNFVGVNTDVLQVGIKASDGKLYAGGGTVVVGSAGIDISVGGVHKTSIQSDGDFFIGNNIDAAASTSLSIFTVAQTYNGESMTGGDLLIGDNTATKSNIKYDASSGRFEFRLGTTVNIIMDTDGSFTFSNNVTGLSFLSTDPLKTGYIKMTNLDDLWIRNSVAGKKIRFSINLTDASTPAMTWSEDGSNTNGTILVIPAGASGAAIGLGSGVAIWTSKNGKETVFNDDSFEVNFRVESATHASAINLNALGEYIQIFGGDLATFDNSTEHRLEIGSDHYFPTRNSSDKTVYINEALQDIDTKIKGTTDASLTIWDAGLDVVAIGGAVDSSYKLKVTGDVNITGKLVGPISAASNANDIFNVANAGASAFVGTINGAPSGASVTYNVTSGNENAMVPSSTSNLGKMRLYNTTRGTSALISNCNTTTNVITLTANAPAGWVNGDTITIASQTVIGGTGNWVDIEITSGVTGKSALWMLLQFLDTTNAGVILRIHPFETFASSKIKHCITQVANVTMSNSHLLPIINNVFTISWDNPGAASATAVIRLEGYIN